MQTIQKTFILAKTDVLERGILGRILKRFEDTGLKIVGAKMLQASKTLANRHYADSPKWKIRIGNKVLETFKENNVNVIKELGTEDPKVLGSVVRQWSIDYLTKTPVLAMVIEGPHAVSRVEEICGHTEPSKAGRGTIRGDFCVDSIIHSNLQKRAIYNLVHSAKDEKEAKRQIKLWFKPNEIVSYENKYEKVLQ